MVHRFESEDGRFALELADHVVRALERLCNEAWPEELGGILVGYYSPDLITAIVTEAMEPPRDSIRSRFSFFRGLSGLRRALRRRWRRPESERRYYLGEWHSHPSGPLAPSGQDHRQMQKIADGRHHYCPEPLLVLVAGSPESGWDPGCWVYRRGAEPLPLRLRLTA